MQTENRPAAPRRRHKTAPLLLAVCIAAGIYLLRRPIPPAEFPTLGDFTGTLTVSHGNAIWGAQLNEHTSRFIAQTLGDCRFRPTEQEGLVFEGDLSLRFSPELLIELTEFEGETYARVSTPAHSSTYLLDRPVYGELREDVYASFPGGVQVLDLQPWWEAYFSIACATILEQDFNSPKEIPPSAVVRYTFRQMVADGTAKEFETLDETGARVNVIPYPLFLSRAREYFADGAAPTIKQTYYFDAASNSFCFPAMDSSYYGNYPYGAYDDYLQNGSYALQSLVRDLDGNVTAVIADYTPRGFSAPGTVSQLHYVTMVSSSTGQYRFVSARTESTSRLSVSLEGYFTSLSDLGGITADEAFERDLQQLGMLDGNLLLSGHRYTGSASRLDLYAVSPITGRVEAQYQIETDPTTVFLNAGALPDGVLVQTNREVLLLDRSLQLAKSLRLPAAITAQQPVSYAVTNDLSTLYYTDAEGVCRYANGERTLLCPHPDGSPLRAPVTVREGDALLLTQSAGENRLRLALLDLTAEPPALRQLGFDFPASSTVLIEEDRVCVQCFDTQTPDAVPTVTRHIFSSFATPGYSFFDLRYDPNLPDRLIAGEHLYYFRRLSPENGTEDHLFGLYRVDLQTLQHTPLSVKICNAVPNLLAADEAGHLLFSYRSPTGAGFGLTNGHEAP